MQIVFYTNFYKKENSTLIPTVGGQGNPTASYTVEGVLKEPCSVMNPVINFQGAVHASQQPPPVSTYAYISKFERYYFVDDWEWNDGLWTVHLSVDVLASFKSHIGSQTEYILRTDSDTTNFDGAISDSMYPATNDFNITKVDFDNPFVTLLSGTSGVYVVGIIGSDSNNSYGAVTYYAMTPTQFSHFKSILFGQTGLEAMNLYDAVTHTWDNADMTESIFKTMYNPYQYISSCTWFPLTISEITGDAVSTIKMGWWDFSQSAMRMTQTLGRVYDSVEQIPVHPQAPTRGKYLNYAPYTKMTLYGKFGSIPIDTAFLEIGSYMINSYSIDYATGQCLFQVFVSPNSAGTNRVLIAKTEFLLGVPIQLAQVGRDYLGMSVNAIEAGKAGMTGALIGGTVGGVGGAIIGAVANAGQSIYNTINSSMPQLQTSGVNGSFISAELSSELVIINFRVVDENIHHKGRPLCQLRQINTLSGFIQCAEGEIDLSCFEEERRMIANFLVSGFFWE